MAGYGDMIVTCFSKGSRNRCLGEAIGKGKPPQEAISEQSSAIEGVHTATSLCLLAKRHGVSLPICETVHEILYRNLPLLPDALNALMGRAGKPEWV
jgi:glycerol-3-phosphate dehydrogenase (NAD(P)+)